MAIIKSDSVRVVTEDELGLFQICPAYLSFSQEHSQIVSQEDDWYFKYKIQAELLRGTLSMWLRRGIRPSMKRIRQKWDIMATRACSEHELTAEHTKEFLITGNSGLTNIWNDIEERGYEIALAKTPLLLECHGVQVRAEPEAIFVAPDQSLIVLNFGPERSTREIVNNLVYRARLAVASELLKQEIFLVHYCLNGERKIFTSRSLYNTQMFKNLYHTAWAITDGYNVPVDQVNHSCKEGCRYYKECFL